MQTNITLEETINTEKYQLSVKVQANKNGVVVFYYDIVQDRYTTVTLTDEQMASEEYLFNVFADTHLCTFRAICNMLDKVMSATGLIS